MQDSVFSPALLRAAAEKVSSAAQQVSSAAQQRVAAEINQFQAEAAKTDQWREEQERSARIQAAIAGGTSLQPPAADPAQRKLVFSIEEDFELATALDGPPQGTEQPPAPAPAPVPAPAAASSSSGGVSGASGASGSADATSAAPPCWEPHLDALLTILDQEARTAKAWREGDESLSAHEQEARGPPAPRMPAAELLLQLHELRSEITISTAGAAGSSAGASAARRASSSGESAPSNVQALQEQVEHLATELAKSELQGRSRGETHRRQVEALEARGQAAEAEAAELMRVVEDHVIQEGEAKASVAATEEELAAVRAKAGARMKALVAQNKALEDQIAELREVEELNRSKFKSLEASILAADDRHAQGTRQLSQDYAYARALVLRYLELEDEHEALFPALAATFKLTQIEVQRIQAAQQQHASASSIWGRTRSAGSRIFEVARAVASEASEARSGNGAPS